MTIANIWDHATRSGTHSSLPPICKSPGLSHFIWARGNSRCAPAVAVFNLFNHDNPRDVQTIVNSSQFGGFYNDAWRTFRGKLVFQL